MLVVAEVGLSHEGSLGTAIAYIRACAHAGAHAVKFQNHENDPCNQFRKGTFFPQDATRQDYWKRTAFTDEGWRCIGRECKANGVELIVSPFSMDAFERLNRLEIVDRWKIASSKVFDHALIDACVATGKPVIVSSGMSTWDELHTAAAKVPNDRLTTLNCVSMYPTPPEKVSVDRRWLRGAWGVSDHSGTPWPAIAACVLGASMAEVHVVFSRECFGPDVTSSITTAELKQLCDGVKFIERMGKYGKDEIAKEVSETRKVFCGLHG